MDGDDVAAGEDLLHGLTAAHFRVPAVCRKEGIIADYLHAEAVDGLLRHHVADLAQA